MDAVDTPLVKLSVPESRNSELRAQHSSHEKHPYVSSSQGNVATPKHSNKGSKSVPPVKSAMKKSTKVTQLQKYPIHVQRLIKYFPELCDSDEYITEFTVN